MTFREAIDRYIKNDECETFLLSAYSDMLDDEIKRSPLNTSGLVLFDLFGPALSQFQRRKYDSNQISIFDTQMNAIRHMIKSFRTNYIYEWKSVVEWVESIQNKPLRDILLKMHDDTGEKMKSVFGVATLEAFDSFRAPNLSTAIYYLYREACLYYVYSLSTVEMRREFFGDMYDSWAFTLRNSRELNDFER